MIAFGTLNKLLIVLFGSTFLLFILNEQKLIIDNYGKHVTLLYFAPMFISGIGAICFYCFSTDVDYQAYFEEDFLTRMLNIILCFLIFLGINTIIDKSSESTLRKLLYSYGYGILILLGVFAVWQILNMFFGVWIIDLATRSNIHSVEGIEIVGLRRITSIADEPSYLAPFILDAMLIFAYLKKYIAVPFFIIILLFSMSLAGYANLIFILIFAAIILLRKIKIKYIVMFFAVVFGLAVIFHDTTSMLFTTVSSRRELSTGFSYQESARTAQIVMPWIFLAEGEPVPLIIGNGPASFKYLHRSETLPSGKKFHNTSNNLYTDVAYEGGLLSFLCLMLLFFYFFRSFTVQMRIKNSREIIFGLLIIFHLMVTSFYRADFVSSRFITILLIINILYRLNGNKNDISNNSDLLPG